MYYITSHCACCVVRSQTERSLSYNAFKLSAKKSLKVSQPHNEINGRVGGIGSMHISSVDEGPYAGTRPRSAGLLPFS